MARRLWFLNLLLLLGIAFFGWSTWRFWSGQPLSRKLPAAGSTESKEAAPVFALVTPPPPQHEYAVVGKQNLFSPTRSPYVPPPPVSAQITPVPPPEVPLDRYILYGTLLMGQNKYYALIKDKKAAGAKPRLYTVGDSLVEGQTVKDISTQRVKIAYPTGETELRLRGPKGPEDTAFVPRAVGAPQMTQPVPQQPMVPQHPMAMPPVPQQPGFRMAAPEPVRPGMPGTAVRQPPVRQPPPVIEEPDLSDEDLSGDEEDTGDEDWTDEE